MAEWLLIRSIRTSLREAFSNADGGKEREKPGPLMARLLRDELAGQSFQSLADLVDALKYRCARLRIRWTPEAISEALRLVGFHLLCQEQKVRA